MKKLVFALTFGLLSMPIFAQEAAKDRRADVSPEERAQKMVRKMAEHLNLNDEQIQELQPLLLKFHQEEMARREAHKKSREELKAEMADILDEEQMAKMEKMHEKRRSKMRKQRRERLEKIEESEVD